MIRKILLPVDGSESAQRAARVAGEVAQKFDAEVLVIYVVLPLPVQIEMAESAGEQLHWPGSKAGMQGLAQAGQEILARTVRELDRLDVRYQAGLERGHPGARICEIAQEEGADLVIIEDQGVNRATAVHPESIWEEVGRCANCSVMIVR